MPRKGMLPPRQPGQDRKPVSVDDGTVIDARELAPGIRARDVDRRVYHGTEYVFDTSGCATVGELRALLSTALDDLPADDVRLSEAHMHDNRLRITLAEGVTR